MTNLHTCGGKFQLCPRYLGYQGILCKLEHFPHWCANLVFWHFLIFFGPSVGGSKKWYKEASDDKMLLQLPHLKLNFKRFGKKIFQNWPNNDDFTDFFGQFSPLQ